MNGFRICALQDLSHILSAKSLQHETLTSTNTVKRYLWSFFNASRKEENACETKKINSLTVFYDPEPISTAWMTLPVMMTLHFRVPMTFSHLEINTKRLEASKPLTKYNDLLSLLDKSSCRHNCYTLPNVLAGDFDFVCGNNRVAINKTDYRDRVLKIFSTHQKNEASVIDFMIEQARINNSSTCITAKNMNNFSLIESKFKKINEQHSKDQFKSQNDQFSQRNLPQSSELQFRNIKRQDFRYIPKYLFLNTIKQQSQQQTIYFTSLRNHGSQKLSSCLTSMPRRVFSTKSCIVIQKSSRIISRKNLNVSSVRLKSTRSHSGALKIPDCVSLARLQSFCHDASKSEKFANCNRRCNTRSKEARDHCEESDIHTKIRSRQEDTCNEKNVSSQSDISKKRRKNESESCERYLCPELQRKLKCRKEQPSDDKKTHQNCDSKGRDARQSKDFKYSQKQDIGMCIKKPRLSTCERYEIREEARVVCTDPTKGKNDCSRESKRKKGCEKHGIREKGRQRCTESNRGQSKNQKRDSSCDKNKTDGKRHYSQQSIFSALGDHRSFSTLIPDIVFGTDGTRKTTQRFYVSCGKDEKDVKLSCEKPKKKCDTDKKDETKKKCVKEPPKCLTRKSIADKKQTCLSTPNDKDVKLHEPTQKSCHEEYCFNRKKAFTMKDEKPKESAKEHPSSVTKDKKQPKIEKSIKEQIDREYREIDECKKTGTAKKDDKKDDKVKKISGIQLDRLGSCVYII